MDESLRIRGILFFGLKFVLFLCLSFALWWVLIPFYGHTLGYTSLYLLNTFFGFDLSGYGIQKDGWLNTNTLLYFEYKLTLYYDYRYLPLSTLTKNLPTYIALILATGGLGMWRKSRVLLYGTLILWCGHLAFILLNYNFAGKIQESPEIPTALAEFFMILPFLLWVWFAYWDKIMAYVSETDTSQQTVSSPQNPTNANTNSVDSKPDQDNSGDSTTSS